MQPATLPTPLEARLPFALGQSEGGLRANRSGNTTHKSPASGFESAFTVAQAAGVEATAPTSPLSTQLENAPTESGPEPPANEDAHKHAQEDADTAQNLLLSDHSKSTATIPQEQAPASATAKIPQPPLHVKQPTPAAERPVPKAPAQVDHQSSAAGSATTGAEGAGETTAPPPTFMNEVIEAPDASRESPAQRAPVGRAEEKAPQQSQLEGPAQSPAAPSPTSNSLHHETPQSDRSDDRAAASPPAQHVSQEPHISREPSNLKRDPAQLQVKQDVEPIRGRREPELIPRDLLVNRTSGDQRERPAAGGSPAAQAHTQNEGQTSSGRHSPHDRTLPQAGRHEAMAPAAARAEQIDQAVRLEQATAQPPAGESSRAAQGNAAQPSAASTSTPEPTLRIGPALDRQITNAQSTLSNTAPAVGIEHFEADDAPLTHRIVRGFTAMVNQRGGSLTMRLDPPELGSLRVQMTLHQGNVTAQLFASTAQAHGLLEKNLAMLRTALESHGLSVERLSVQVNQPAQQSPNSQQHHHHDGSRSAQQDAYADAGDGQSRGRREHEPDAQGGAMPTDPEWRDFARLATDEALALEGALDQ